MAALAVPVLHGQKEKATMFGDADAYERFMGRWSRLVAPPLIEFAGIADAGRVLDVGSGTGSLAFAIAKHKPGCSVIGVDRSKEYVAYASSHNILGDRVRFEVGDAQQLPFEAATFNNSLSLLVFNFIPDPAKALAEAHRVTKPGGRVVAAIWDYGGEMQMLRIFWDAVVSLDPHAEALDEKRMPLCRAGELSDLWKRGGLKNVEERPLEITTRFSSFADYWDSFLLGQGPAGAYMRKLTPDRLPVLRGAVKKQLHLSDENSPFAISARAWAVRGAV